MLGEVTDGTINLLHNGRNDMNLKQRLARLEQRTGPTTFDVVLIGLPPKPGSHVKSYPSREDVPPGPAVTVRIKGLEDVPREAREERLTQ